MAIMAFALVPNRLSMERDDPSALCSREVPVRTDRTGHAFKSTGDEFGDENTVVVDRSGHDGPALWHPLESDAAVIIFVAAQHHQAMLAGPGVVHRAFEQLPADAAAAEWRLDGKRSEHQRLGIADTDRQLTHRSDQQRADPRGEGEIAQMIDIDRKSTRL